MKKYIFTGGNGRFASQLKKIFKNSKKYIFLNKKQLDILKRDNIKNVLKRYKPYAVIHMAGLSRPMVMHETNIQKSISLNIIGTSNIILECEKKNIKVIYFSTNYVYPGQKGNYKENSPLLPINNYAWSKLGGEAAVQMYKNSLILRLCMTEKPFIHSHAYANVKSNFIYQEDVAKIIIKILDKKGIINVGGSSKYIYNFAKINNKTVKKKFSKGEFPKRMDMSLKKLKNLINL